MKDADHELVQRWLAGDAGAMDALARRFYRQISAALAAWTGRRDHAEDLCQEVFARAIESRTSLADPERFGSWLYGIARNCFREWTRRKREAPLEDVVSSPREDRYRKLIELVCELPEPYRQVALLKHCDGLKCREIAERMGKPLGTVLSLLSRAHEKLMEMSRDV